MQLQVKYQKKKKEKKKNLFRSKQTTKKVLANKFRNLEVRKKVRFMF